MTDKDERRAQALRANLRRRKTWQRSKDATAKTDKATSTDPAEAGNDAATDKTKPDAS